MEMLRASQAPVAGFATGGTIDSTGGAIQNDTWREQLIAGAPAERADRAINRFIGVLQNGTYDPGAINHLYYWAIQQGGMTPAQVSAAINQRSNGTYNITPNQITGLYRMHTGVYPGTLPAAVPGLEAVYDPARAAVQRTGGTDAQLDNDRTAFELALGALSRGEDTFAQGTGYHPADSTATRLPFRMYNEQWYLEPWAAEVLSGLDTIPDVVQQRMNDYGLTLEDVVPDTAQRYASGATMPVSTPSFSAPSRSPTAMNNFMEMVLQVPADQRNSPEVLSQIMQTFNSYAPTPQETAQFQAALLGTPAPQRPPSRADTHRFAGVPPTVRDTPRFQSLVDGLPPTPTTAPPAPVGDIGLASLDTTATTQTAGAQAQATNPAAVPSNAPVVMPPAADPATTAPGITGVLPTAAPFRPRASSSPNYMQFRNGRWGYAMGGPVAGPGDGVSDSIPTSINGQQPAALSDGEYVLPAHFVSALGNGSTKAGVQQIQNMVDRVMSAKYGTNNPTPRPLNPRRFTP